MWSFLDDFLVLMTFYSRPRLRPDGSVQQTVHRVPAAGRRRLHPARLQRGAGMISRISASFPPCSSVSAALFKDIIQITLKQLIYKNIQERGRKYKHCDAPVRSNSAPPQFCLVSTRLSFSVQGGLSEPAHRRPALPNQEVPVVFGQRRSVRLPHLGA